MRIPSYIINLESRHERKVNVLMQFSNRNEFSVSVIRAVKHTIGATGLWESIKNIIRTCINHNDDFILICEDDHKFTEHYNYELLTQCIKEAKNDNAHILCGGVSWFEDAIQVSENPVLRNYKFRSIMLLPQATNNIPLNTQIFRKPLCLFKMAMWRVFPFPIFHCTFACSPKGSFGQNCKNIA